MADIQSPVVVAVTTTLPANGVPASPRPQVVVEQRGRFKDTPGAFRSLGTRLL